MSALTLSNSMYPRALASERREVLDCLLEQIPFTIAKTITTLSLANKTRGGSRRGETGGEGRGEAGGKGSPSSRKKEELRSEHMKSLVSGLKNNSTLTTLNINNNPLGDKGVITLSNWLPNSSVRALYLNRMGYKGAEQLSKVLKNTTLEILYLDKNSIGDEGAIFLSEGMKVNTSLKELCLRSNEIGGKGLEYLLEGLKVNTNTLRELDLKCDRNPGCEMIAGEYLSEFQRTKGGLYRASFVGNVQRMLSLLSTKEGKNQLYDTLGATPLHLAVMGDQLQAVQVILAFGADPTLPNKEGKRPIDLAKSDAVRQELLRESLETVKVVVLGHGRVGKTTTIKVIKELEAGAVQGRQQQKVMKRASPENSTIGLDVSSLFLPKKGEGERETKIRIWDFAGQLEYLPCHHRFLSSKRTIFIIMVDGSRSLQKQKEDLEYWLKFISRSIQSRDKEGRFSSERILIVVGTKIDLREREDVISLSQTEKQYLEVVLRVDEGGKFFNKDWIRTASISNMDLGTGVSQLQRELFEVARVVKENGVVDPSTLQKALALFSKLQGVAIREGAVVCRYSEHMDLDALEYLHNAGEVAFLKEIGWVCLDGPALERCVGLFIGPEPHQQVLGVTRRNREAVREKEEVLSHLRDHLSLTHPQVIQTGVPGRGIEEILEVMKDIGICFESEEQITNKVEVVFPSELGGCDNLVLPLSQQQQQPTTQPQQEHKDLCHQWSIFRRKKEEDIGGEEFQKLLSALWRIRYEGYRTFINGMLVVPPSVTREEAKNQGSEEETTTKIRAETVTLVELKSGRVVITSRSQKALSEVATSVFDSLGSEEGFHIEKKEERERSPIWSEIGDERTGIPPTYLLSSEQLSQLLSQSTPSISRSSSSSTTLSLPAISRDPAEFFGVTLTPHDSHPSLQREFESVRRKLFEFLSKGHMDFDFELEKVVMIFNSEVEARFLKKMHDFLWNNPTIPEVPQQFEEQGNEGWKRRLRVLKHLGDYVLQVPGNERTNLLLAWHAHERQSLYSNAVKGQFVPGQVDKDIIQELKQGQKRGDFGYFGRGAYFSQTPQYVLPYVRDSGREFVLQLSWILPGRVYPVIEPIVGPTTLHGQSCVPGFDSHYVLTDGVMPVGLGEEVIGDELVVFSSDQVYPRYLVFLKRALSIPTLFGGIEGTGFGVLPFGPVLVWVDNKVPDVLPEIKISQELSPKPNRVQVFHFRSTGEALSWMAKHLESLLFKARLRHLRIGTNSYRAGEVEVMAGKRLYQLIRQTKGFNKTPVLLYCGDRNTAGFTKEEQENDRFLRITEQYEEALSFGGGPIPSVSGWLKEQSFEWMIVRGPGLVVHVNKLLGLSESKKKEQYFATLSLISDTNPKKSGTLLCKTEVEVGGRWEAFLPTLSLNQGIRLTVFQRTLLRDIVVGSVDISAKDIAKMKAGESEEVKWTLGNGTKDGKKKGREQWKRKKVKMRMLKLESESGWF